MVSFRGGWSPDPGLGRAGADGVQRTVFGIVAQPQALAVQGAGLLVAAIGRIDSIDDEHCVRPSSGDLELTACSLPAVGSQRYLGRFLSEHHHDDLKSFVSCNFGKLYSGCPMLPQDLLQETINENHVSSRWKVAN